MDSEYRYWNIRDKVKTSNKFIGYVLIILQKEIGMYTAVFNDDKESNYVFDKQKSILRKKGFIWGAYFLAYKCEASCLYSDIERTWSDLDAITERMIAFVIADESASTILHIRNEITRKKYCPRGEGHSFSETNTIMTPMGMDVFGLKHEQIPCLVFKNLLNDKLQPIIIPLSIDSDIFLIMKYISIRTRDCNSVLNEYTQIIARGYRQIETYCNMVERFINTTIGLEVDGYSAKRIIEDLPNDYAAARLCSMWKIVTEDGHKKIWENSQRSSLAHKIIELRWKIDKSYGKKMSTYKKIMSEVECVHKEIYNVVSELDIEKCKEDAIKYALEQVDLLKSKLSICVENTVISNEIDELGKCLRIADKLPQKVNDVLKSLDKLRESEPLKLFDDYGRVLVIISTIKSLISLLI